MVVAIVGLVASNETGRKPLLLPGSVASTCSAAAAAALCAQAQTLTAVCRRRRRAARMAFV
jgi:hypothetical protein